MFFRELKRKKLAPEILADRVGCSVETLRSKDAWIDWDAFLRFMVNVGRVWTNDELEEFGDRFLASPFIRWVGVVARLLFTPKDFYLWAMSPTGPGMQMVTCIQSSCESVG